MPILNESGCIKEHISAIYNPLTRKVVSPMHSIESDGRTVLQPIVSHIGKFTTDENGITYAIARIGFEAYRGNSKNSERFHLYGKMDMNGRFISNLYNTATRGTIKIDRKGFSFNDEVNRSIDYINNHSFVKKAHSLEIVR